MQDMSDLKNAFGEADDGFKDNVCRILADLKKYDEKKPSRKISLRLIAVTAVVFVLTSSAFAMSNAWGIFGFPPGAAKIVQTGLPQSGGKSERASFSVREAVYDGKNIYLVVEAKPADPKYMLIPEDSIPSDPVHDLGPLFKNEQGSISGYAEKNGKIPARVAVSLPPFVTEQSRMSSSNSIIEADGTAVIMINSAYESDKNELALALDCLTALPDEDEEVRRNSIRSSSLSVTLQNSGTKDIATNTEAAEYLDCGVRVDKIKLTASPIAIYAEVEYSVIDEAKFSELGGGLWFDFIDESGSPLPRGTANSRLGAVDENRTRFLQNVSLQASESLPGEITLRGRISGVGKLSEAHTFEME